MNSLAIRVDPGIGLTCRCSAPCRADPGRSFWPRHLVSYGRLRSQRIFSESEDADISRNSRSNDRSHQGGAVAIPEGLKTAGSVFVLAGFLKILIVCFPFSTMAVSMYFQGLFDLGTWAAIKMMPLAIGILALAKAIIDRKIHERKWAPAMIALCGVFALIGSRWAFARPRPSPLDPALAQYRKVREYEHAMRKQQEARRGMRQLDPEMSERAKSLRSQSRFPEQSK